MDCKEAREGLWPPERPRLAGDEVLEAREHLERCPGCREYFQQDRVILDAYERLRRERAPREVRERVYDALARARRGDGMDGAAAVRGGWTRRVTRAWPVLAAAVAAVALGWQGFGPPARADGDAGKFVEDYLRRAVGQDHIETHDPDEVGRFLARELGMSIRPLDVEGLELEGAEICLLEGRRGAMIVYKKDGAAVSHYLVPRAEAGSRAPSLSPEAADGMGGSPPVVTWSTPAVEQALVGELSSEQLLHLARLGATE